MLSIVALVHAASEQGSPDRAVQGRDEYIAGGVSGKEACSEWSDRKFISDSRTVGPFPGSERRSAGDK